MVEITGLKLRSRNWGKPASISPRRAALELSNGVFQIWNTSKQKIADLDVRPIFLEVGGKFLSSQRAAQGLAHPTNTVLSFRTERSVERS